MINQMILTIVNILLAGLLTAIIVFMLNKSENQERKLYGPLRFHLLMLKLLEEQLTEVKNKFLPTNSIRQDFNSFDKHAQPISDKRGINEDIIITLLADYPGYIKKKHLILIKDFIDDCMRGKMAPSGLSIGITEKKRIATQRLQKELLDPFLM